MGKKIDIAGQRFGKLVALEPTEKRKNGLIVWKFRCDCGNIHEIPGAWARAGNSKSCGCEKNKGLVKYNQEQSEKNKIEIGTRFGKLIVIEDLGLKEHVEGHNRRYYKCKCDCGNEIEVFGYCLKSGNTSSCGCTNSKGEEKIIKILLDNDISFSHDKTINGIYEDTGKRLRFDFILYDKENNITRVIEFDGKQHFTGMSKGVWSNIISLDEIKERDRIKNNWCIKNNIPIVRIPYYKLDTLNINDILLDTFLVK